MKSFKQLLTTFLIGVGLSLAAYAQPPTLYSPNYQSGAHKKVLTAVENYVQETLVSQGSENISVSAFPIDKRIALANCSLPYRFAMTEGNKIQTYSTVKVTCPESTWYLFVNVKIEELKRTVVTSEMLSPGALLTEQNLSIVDISTQKIRQTTFSHVSDLEGARLKHRVRAGQPVTPNMVCFVCKGDVITLAATVKGLRISTKGIAQQDGNRGDTIRVKNSRSAKVVLAKVKNHTTAIVNI
jgi:flagella basal body P-ring formation protein FlgA